MRSFSIGQKTISARAIVILIIVLILGFMLFRRSAAAPQTPTVSLEDATELSKAEASATINREFTFPLKDAAGKNISNLKYKIENADLRKEIFIKGQKATAVNGRAFLVFDIKVTNGYNSTIQMNTRDYIRLSTDGKEWAAPEIHNDPVAISAIATQNTRLGFAVNEKDRVFKLQVGEVKGQKTIIDVKLK